MKKLVRFALLTLAFVLSGAAFGQSNLPACKGSDTTKWNNCFGTWVYLESNEYIGEFVNGKFHGQGTYSLSNGGKYIGEFKYGKYNGQGVILLQNGSILQSGIYENDKLVTAQYVDPNGFKRISKFGNEPAITDLVTFPPSPNGAVLSQNNLSASQRRLGQPENSQDTGFGWWICIEGYKKSDNQCVSIFADMPNGKQPANSWVSNDSWFCNDGYQKSGNQCVSIFADMPNGKQPANSWVSRWSWFCNDGYQKSGNQCVSVLANTQRDQSKVEGTAPLINEAQRVEADRVKNELEKERQRLAEDRRRLDAEKAQREEEKKSSRIAIKGNVTQPDANGDFTITISTGADTASLKIDGDELGGRRDGNYVIKRVARVGDENSYKITARDVFGNTDSATVTVARQVADSRPAIPKLNPANVRVRQSRDAVAIIIGIENYRRVAKADFANADAKEFYTYASRALGIKPENIKLLVDDGADLSDVLDAFQNWLPLKVNKGKTDVYVFYSGHGYPSQDGKGLYFLPFNVDSKILDRTSVKQIEVVAALQRAQAKSVTMFIDACYSGQTRNGDVLVAGIKPVFIKADDKAYPPEFTVITASAADQFSSASPDLKHGIFSFYLMKALEGDADENSDGRLTSGELQRYLSEMVGRQAMGLNRVQNTQLFGGADRVLMTR